MLGVNVDPKRDQKGPKWAHTLPRPPSTPKGPRAPHGHPQVRGGCKRVQDGPPSIRTAPNVERDQRDVRNIVKAQRSHVSEHSWGTVNQKDRNNVRKTKRDRSEPQGSKRLTRNEKGLFGTLSPKGVYRKKGFDSRTEV